MIETHHLKNVVIFVQTILSFVLSRKSTLLYFYSILFSSYYAAFEKSFDDWTMILSSPVLLTFTRTKTLALPPILPEIWQLNTRERSCPMACISMRKAYYVVLNEWFRELYLEFVFKLWWCSIWPITCPAPGSSKWL